MYRDISKKRKSDSSSSNLILRNKQLQNDSNFMNKTISDNLAEISKINKSTTVDTQKVHNQNFSPISSFYTQKTSSIYNREFV